MVPKRSRVFGERFRLESIFQIRLSTRSFAGIERFPDPAVSCSWMS